jgi:hypothetical protein
MQWFGRRESDNYEDDNGGGGFGGRGMIFGGGIIGVIGTLIYLFTGVNPAQLLGGGNGNQQDVQNTRTQNQNGQENPQHAFSRVVLADTEDIWGKLFQDMGRTYQDPKIVFYSEYVQSGCGGASSSTGPFYCPQDDRVYLDLSFFDELQNKLGAPGDFARAYVIAHEVGHHVQNLLGTSAKVEQAESQADESGRNKLSVKLELQADFYAGVWAHYEQSIKKVINEQDIEQALNAAKAVGDDRLQQETQGTVVPDSFTHGTSAQRMYWFKKGYDTGDIKQGNTFADVSME